MEADGQEADGIHEPRTVVVLSDMEVNQIGYAL